MNGLRMNSAVVVVISRGRIYMLLLEREGEFVGPKWKIGRK